jgi:hypothetical protein
MMQQLWKLFPRHLEQRLNQLLDQAVPNPTKMFQLYKTCQSENLWEENLENFAAHVNVFCSVPRNERRKSQLDSWLNRPLDRSIYENFHFTFRSVFIEPTEIRNIASWAHHLMRLNMKVQAEAISIQVLEKTFERMTQPTTFDKESDLEFSDFCETWKSVIGPNWDSKKKFELDQLLEDLYQLDVRSKNIDAQVTVSLAVERTQIDLTQTELDWIIGVRRVAFVYGAMPNYPLRKGPDKKQMIELEKMVKVYNIIQLADSDELTRHRENIRATILEFCDSLLYAQAV